jgi:hypothetical protein
MTRIKQIEEMDVEKNDEIIAVYVEAVLMPNGEIIRNGKSIGWDNKAKGVFKEIQ